MASRYELDEVVFVPAARPWQKAGRALAPAEDRYLMTVIATAPNPRFTVSRVELDRPGDSYTIDTLREFTAARGPETELYFVLGADALLNLQTWRNTAELFALAHFVGVTRPGYELSAAGLPAKSVSLLELPATMSISSTDIRQRVAAGRPIWYLVPDGVVQYIAKHGLYRQPAVGVTS